VISKRIFVNIIVIIFASTFIVSRSAYSDDANNSEYSTCDDKYPDKYVDKKNILDKPLYDDQKYDQEGYNLDIQNNKIEYKDPYENTQNIGTEKQTYESDSSDYKANKEDDENKNSKPLKNIRGDEDSDYNNVDKEHNVIDLQVPPAN